MNGRKGDEKKDQGAVCLFGRSLDQWVEEDRVVACDGGPEDAFAHSLAAHGDRIAFGANIADGVAVDEEAANVYQLLSMPKISNGRQ